MGNKASQTVKKGEVMPRKWQPKPAFGPKGSKAKLGKIVGKSL